MILRIATIIAIAVTLYITFTFMGLVATDLNLKKSRVIGTIGSVGLTIIFFFFGLL